MFRTLSGFKAQYHHLTLLVVQEFDEWRVLVYGPGMTLHGHRQFGEAKAKGHALSIAKGYVHAVKCEDLPELTETEWTATGRDDWLVWSG